MAVTPVQVVPDAMHVPCQVKLARLNPFEINELVFRRGEAR
jgi:hypothetical protein